MTRPEMLADDRYDQALTALVAPADWTNPEPGAAITSWCSGRGPPVS